MHCISVDDDARSLSAPCQLRLMLSPAGRVDELGFLDEPVLSVCVKLFAEAGVRLVQLPVDRRFGLPQSS